MAVSEAMRMLEAPLPILSFLFGVLSVLTPCVLPVIPVIGSYAARTGRFVPLALVSGFSISFVAMGILASAFGQILQPLGDLLRYGAGGIMILMGVYILIEEYLPPGVLSGLSLSRVLGGLSSKVGAEINGIGGGVLLGVTLGIVWIPCIGPILGSILAMVAVEAKLLYGSFLLILYSAGMAIPFLIIAYGSNLAVKRVKALSSHLPLISRLSGVILIAAGIYFGMMG
ncbi:MAG: cytochrome c biogenesis protein CcdA [Candidatus Syntrophoarchaeum sp. WYZ-LMO15]|nr:MAG: cytochrome c biogenesis protein CcdA [Candidatus Syntrophoarchaeum sp. WYZ-LMO15]